MVSVDELRNLVILVVDFRPRPFLTFPTRLTAHSVCQTRTVTGNDHDWLPASSHHLVKTSGVRLAVAVGGSRAPLVLLHGWPQTGRVWRHVMPALAEQRTVVVPDLRGTGESERPDGEHFTPRSWAIAMMAAGSGALPVAFDAAVIARHGVRSVRDVVQMVEVSRQVSGSTRAVRTEAPASRRRIDPGRDVAIEPRRVGFHGQVPDPQPVPDVDRTASRAHRLGASARRPRPGGRLPQRVPPPRPPLPTLFSLVPGCVAYLGTTSKVLTPALRCG